MINVFKCTTVAATAIFLTACASTSALTSDQVSQIDVEVESYGLYEISQVKEVNNDTYIAGSSLTAGSYVLSEQTDTITAKVGTTFGASFKFSGLPTKQKIIFREVMKFPEMTDPDTGMTQSYYESSREFKNGTRKYKGFTFEYDWELVKGDWIYQIYYQDTLLAEQAFKVK